NPQGGAALNNEILIVLKDDHGTVIDQVQLGAGGAPSGDALDLEDEAVARVPNGQDSGDDGADFIQQAATPCRGNVPGKPPPQATPTGTLPSPTTTKTAAATDSTQMSATSTRTPTVTRTPTLTRTPTPTITPSATQGSSSATGILLNEFLPHPS